MPSMVRVRLPIKTRSQKGRNAQTPEDPKVVLKHKIVLGIIFGAALLLIGFVITLAVSNSGHFAGPVLIAFGAVFIIGGAIFYYLTSKENSEEKVSEVNLESPTTSSSGQEGEASYNTESETPSSPDKDKKITSAGYDQPFDKF